MCLILLLKTCILEVDSKNEHTHINLLKLDIEGSEICILKQMLKDEIFPDYILVEFDLIFKNVDFNNETNDIIV